MAERSKKSKNLGGRPKKEIDAAELEKLAALQCTQPEAAAWFDISLPTLKRRLKETIYAEAWENGQAKGRASLRRLQFRLAENNAAMAIFLGKQYLGQSDKNVVEHQGDPFAGVLDAVQGRSQVSPDEDHSRTTH